MKKITKEWLISAEDDFEVINKIIDAKHLTHRVAFHSQQAIEKCFKAVIEEFELGIIKIHDLETLFNKVENYIHFKVEIETLKELDKLSLLTD